MRDFLRIIDANLNRLREGIRVAEDILRYQYDDQPLALALKNLRHQSRSSFGDQCLASRDSAHDVLRPSIEAEQARADIRAVLIANFKRAQESARVLEETLKLHSGGEAERFKHIRYELYALEKAAITTHCG